MSRHTRRNSAKGKRPKTRLGLPDLDHSKNAVLNSLRSPGVEARLPTRDRRIHSVVLFRATAVLQQDCGDTLPHLSRRSSARRGHNQWTARCCAAAGLRSSRRRASQPGACGRHPTRQRRKEVGCEAWKLAPPCFMGLIIRMQPDCCCR